VTGESRLEGGLVGLDGGGPWVPESGECGAGEAGSTIRPPCIAGAREPCIAGAGAGAWLEHARSRRKSRLARECQPCRSDVRREIPFR
jgi:hypothetical protein